MQTSERNCAPNKHHWEMETARLSARPVIWMHCEDVARDPQIVTFITLKMQELLISGPQAEPPLCYLVRQNLKILLLKWTSFQILEIATLKPNETLFEQNHSQENDVNPPFLVLFDTSSSRAIKPITGTNHGAIPPWILFNNNKYYR